MRRKRLNNRISHGCCHFGRERSIARSACTFCVWKRLIAMTPRCWGKPIQYFDVLWSVHQFEKLKFIYFGFGWNVFGGGAACCHCIEMLVQHMLQSNSEARKKKYTKPMALDYHFIRLLLSRLIFNFIASKLWFWRVGYSISRQCLILPFFCLFVWFGFWLAAKFGRYSCWTLTRARSALLNTK